jgi:Zn-dependent protease with chaperone function
MQMRNAITSLLLASTLVACTTPQATDEQRQPSIQTPTVDASAPAVTQGIERYMEQRRRVEAVAFRLKKAALAECAAIGRTKPDLGIIVWSLGNFPNPDDQAHLKGAYGLGNGVTVALATDGGPARRAGLTNGDVITAVNGRPTSQGSGATERFIGASNLAARDGAVTLDLASGRSLTITPDQACDYPALLVRSPDINAAADGTSIAITTGLFDITKSDDELALILGHELAHNTLGHSTTGSSPSSRAGKLLDTMLRSALAQPSAAYSPAKEMEADNVGLYVMARAGFDIAAAETMWTRLNRMNKGATLAATHPSGPDRLAALKKAIAEIRAKQKAGQPLTPHQ